MPSSREILAILEEVNVRYHDLLMKDVGYYNRRNAPLVYAVQTVPSTIKYQG